LLVFEEKSMFNNWSQVLPSGPGAIGSGNIFPSSTPGFDMPARPPVTKSAPFSYLVILNFQKGEASAHLDGSGAEISSFPFVVLELYNENGYKAKLFDQQQMWVKPMWQQGSSQVIGYNPTLDVCIRKVSLLFFNL